MEWLKEKINTFWKWLDHCFFQQKFLSINGEKANKSFKIPNSLPCFQKFLFYIIGFNRFTLMFQKLSPTSFQFFVALLLFMSTITTMQNLILEQKNVFLLAILQHKRGINVLIPFQKKKIVFMDVTLFETKFKERITPLCSNVINLIQEQINVQIPSQVKLFPSW